MLAAAAGCYWLRYADLARTHVELLERLALDARDAMAAGHRLSNSDIETMQYPLERADQFARISDRQDPPASLVAMRETIEAYRQMVELLDRLRVAEASDEDRARVDELAKKVSASARRTVAALEEE